MLAALVAQTVDAGYTLDKIVIFTKSFAKLCKPLGNSLGAFSLWRLEKIVKNNIGNEQAERTL